MTHLGRNWGHDEDGEKIFLIGFGIRETATKVFFVLFFLFDF